VPLRGRRQRRKGALSGRRRFTRPGPQPVGHLLCGADDLPGVGLRWPALVDELNAVAEDLAHIGRAAGVHDDAEAVHQRRQAGCLTMRPCARMRATAMAMRRVSNMSADLVSVHSVPCRPSASGMPIGEQFIGACGSDSVLLQVAAAFERAAPEGWSWPPL